MNTEIDECPCENCECGELVEADSREPLCIVCRHGACIPEE